MIVCGLDQAPAGTGFAYGDGSSRPEWGYKSFHDYGDNEGLLARHVCFWFKAFAKSAGVEKVYTEQIIVYPQRIDIPVLLRQAGVVVGIGFAAADLGIKHYQADVGKWRKHFLRTAGGSTEVLKNLAMVRCADRGWLIDNHHIAEACGIWDYALCMEDPSYRHRSASVRRRLDTKADDAAREARS
jgi:hypothetical protein